MPLDTEDLELITEMKEVWNSFYTHMVDDRGPDEQDDSVIMANCLTELFYKLHGDI